MSVEKMSAKGTRMIRLIRRGVYQPEKKRKAIAKCPHCGAGLTIPLDRHYKLEFDCARREKKETKK